MTYDLHLPHYIDSFNGLRAVRRYLRGHRIRIGKRWRAAITDNYMYVPLYQRGTIVGSVRSSDRKYRWGAAQARLWREAVREAQVEREAELKADPKVLSSWEKYGGEAGLCCHSTYSPWDQVSVNLAPFSEGGPIYGFLFLHGSHERLEAPTVVEAQQKVEVRAAELGWRFE